MDVANVVDGRVSLPSGTLVQRVDTPDQLAELIPKLKQDPEMHQYMARMLRDPLTLMLQAGEGACIVCSVIDHPLTDRICWIAWAQNPDRFGPGDLRDALHIVHEWARGLQVRRVVALIGEDGPWDRVPAMLRLTGYTPWARAIQKELG